MGRIRSIKPEFPQSESIGRMTRDARLCFIELWTIADDEGRLRGNTRMLASLLFPYDDDAPGLIGSWLSEIEREGCIVRYEGAGQHYIQVSNWAAHQKIDKPSPSKFPTPPVKAETPSAAESTPRQFAEGSRTANLSSRPFAEDSASIHRGLGEDSANDRRTLATDMDLGKDQGEEGKGSSAREDFSSEEGEQNEEAMMERLVQEGHDSFMSDSSLATMKQDHDDVMTNHDDIMRESKLTQQEEQEEEKTRACEDQTPIQETSSRGASANEPIIFSELPQFRIAGYWFRKYNQVTGITLLPDERANHAAKELYEALGKNNTLAQRAVDYYFENWRELWFAQKRMPKETPLEKRQWSFTFISFTKNIQEILSLMQASPTSTSPQTTPERWSTGISFDEEHIPEEERAENARKLASFVQNLGKTKRVSLLAN